MWTPLVKTSLRSNTRQNPKSLCLWAGAGSYSQDLGRSQWPFATNMSKKKGRWRRRHPGWVFFFLFFFFICFLQFFLRSCCQWSSPEKKAPTNWILFSFYLFYIRTQWSTFCYELVAGLYQASNLFCSKPISNPFYHIDQGQLRIHIQL